jgi:hypothetical protein
MQTNSPEVPTPGPATKPKKGRAGFRLFKRDDAGRTVPARRTRLQRATVLFRLRVPQKEIHPLHRAQRRRQSQTRARRFTKKSVEAVIRDDRKALIATKLKQSELRAAR